MLNVWTLGLILFLLTKTPIVSNYPISLLPRTGRRNTEHFGSFVHMFLNYCSGSQSLGSADGSQTKVPSLSLHGDFQIPCL